MSDYEYLLTVKKLDEIFDKKEKKQNVEIFEEKDIKFKKVENKKINKTNVKNFKEDDLYQEIYGKFNSNYSELVEDYVQTLVKFENKKIKNAYIVGFMFCIISLSLVVLFSSLIPI